MFLIEIVICREIYYEKRINIKTKNADKDLNIIIYSTLMPLIIYLLFGSSIMNFARTSEMNIWLRFIPVMLTQLGLAGLGSIFLFMNKVFFRISNI